MTLKLGTSSIRVLETFEKITKVSAVDCIIADSYICFLVDPEKIGQAIGKNGSMIKDLCRIFSKPVKIFGYYKDAESLVKSVIPSVTEIEKEDDILYATVPPEEKMEILEKNSKNIKILKEILNRHFKIKGFRLK